MNVKQKIWMFCIRKGGCSLSFKRHYTLLSNQRCLIQSTTTYYDQPVLQTWTCGATCRKAATVHSLWNLFKPVLFFLRRGAIVLLCKKHETIFTFNEKKFFQSCALIFAIWSKQRSRISIGRQNIQDTKLCHF